jgi:hypothetical protein
MLDLLIDIPYLWLADGYGQTGPGVVLELAEFCDRHGLSWKVLRSQIITPARDRQEETRYITSHFVSRKEANPSKVYLRYNYPKLFTAADRPLADKLVTYTMFETDRCPSGWVPALDQADLVLVPTPNQRDLFQVATQTPVATLYLPLHSEYYQKYDNAKLTGSLPKRFTFSFVGTATNDDRKGIKALCTSFANSGLDADLKIRCRNWTPPADKRVKVDSRESKTVAEMLDFYLSSHCGVYPSRGEGYGLPQIETSLLGRPVIVTNNSAMSWAASQMPWVDMLMCESKPAHYDNPGLGDYGNWGYTSQAKVIEAMEETMKSWVKSPGGYIKDIATAHKTNNLREILSSTAIQNQLDEQLLPLF